MMIPVVFITDNNFVMQTGVAITSLIKNKNFDTKYDIFIIASNCEDKNIKRLKDIAEDGCDITVIEASVEKYSDIKQLAHIPIACLLKFDICDMVEAYNKFIYLDGDIYIRGDLSDLYKFEMGDAYIAGVRSVETVFDGKKQINAGVLLFNAKKMRDDNMSEKLIQVRHSLGDRSSMDQQTFNIVMQDTMKFLPLKYNVIPEKFLGREKNIYSLHRVNKLYGEKYKNKKEINKDAIILHYATGGKPWKYTFVPCGDEWYECYKNSVFRDCKINRKNRINQLKMSIFNHYKKNGFKGIVNRSIKIVKTHIGIDKSSQNWG